MLWIWNFSQFQICTWNLCSLLTLGFPRPPQSLTPTCIKANVVFWSFSTKVSSQILICSTLLTHRVLLRTRTCAPPPQEVPTSSSCRRTTRPMLHCVTSLAEKVAMEVFRGFVKRNLEENIAAWLLTAISSSPWFSSTLQLPHHPSTTYPVHRTTLCCL